MNKFRYYLETLNVDKIEKMYGLIFGNPIENYSYMDKYQMIEEIIDEIIDIN